MSVAVSTPVFDGPFDLLLHLILKDEVDLYEVSLSTIVDEYIAAIDQMETLELEVATEFLLIAATLVELKSRRLLPDPPNPDLDEELALWEERDLLLARLLECKTFKDAALSLQVLSADASRSYPRRSGIEEPFMGLVPDLLENVDVIDLRDAFLRASAPKPVVKVSTDHLAPITFNVSDAVNELVVDLPERGKVTFRAITSQLVDRIEVVVYFLALLEMYKQDLVEISQFTSFGEIEVEWTADVDGQAALDMIDAYDG
ncbi:MAG: segregation/condensation protein A [Actinomycetota bacterium]